MGRRRWTAEETDIVRDLYATSTVVEIAKRLGRTAGQVYREASRLGLGPKQVRWPECVLAEVKRLHAEGLNDREIAAAMADKVAAGDEGRLQVRHIRSDRLGLPKNREAVLAAQRRGVVSQLARLGVSTTGGLRSLSYRRFAVENGWPPDLRPREVQILNVLAARGVPMTRIELSEAIGMRTDRRTTRGSLVLLMGNGPGGTYTASLMRRGLLVSIKRFATVHGQGRGKSRDAYMLGPAAMSILQERAKCQTETDGTA